MVPKVLKGLVVQLVIRVILERKEHKGLLAPKVILAPKGHKV